MKLAIIRLAYLFIVIQLIFGKYVFSQTHFNSDSAFKAIAQMKDDTAKVKSLLTLGIPLEEKDAVLCKRVYDEALRVSRQIHSGRFECKSLISLGILNKTHGKYEQAGSYYKQAYKCALKANDTEYIGKALSNMGNIYVLQNKFEVALKSYLEAIKYIEKVNDPKALSLTYGNIGNIFQKQYLYNKSIEYGNKAVDAALLSKDRRTIGLAYSNLSVTYFGIGDGPKNFELCMKALNYLRHSPFNADLYRVYQNLGTYYGYSDYRKANAYCDSALQVAFALGRVEFIASSLLLKGGIARVEKKFSLAADLLQQGKKYAEADGSMTILMHCYKQLYLLAEARGNYKEAFFYAGKCWRFSDSLRNENIGKSNLALEALYQDQKKQAEIRQLQNEKEIQQLTLRQKNIWLFTLIGSLLLLSVIGFLFYLNTNRKQLLARQTYTLQEQQIKELEQQKQLVAANSILQGQEEERSRIAKDLHDGIGGMLSGIKLNLSAMKGNMDIQEKDALLFSRSINQLDSAINEMRRLAHNMVPEALLKFGLPEAIQDYCDGINESHLVNMRFTQLGWQHPADQTTEVILYRIVQELCNNAIKHSGAKNIFVQLSRHEQGISVTVEDDGKGFDITQLASLKGVGLQNVQSRVDYLKGILEIQSSPATGTSVNIEISNS